MTPRSEYKVVAVRCNGVVLRCPRCGQECVSVRQYPNGHTYVHESSGGLNLHFCYVREA